MSEQHKVAFVESVKCVGCGVCATTCSDNAISIADDLRARVNPKKCTGCGNCVTVCAPGAIEMISKPSPSLPRAALKLALKTTIKILSKVEEKLT